MIYVRARAKWPRARDQKVTGATPATSRGGGAIGTRWGWGSELESDEQKEGKGRGSSQRVVAVQCGLGAGSTATNLSRRSPDSEEEDGAIGAMQGSSSSSSWSRGKSRTWRS